MKLLSVLILALTLAGCYGDETKSAGIPITNQYQTVCIDGVSYILFRKSAYQLGFGFMTVKFNPDSTVVTC